MKIFNLLTTATDSECGTTILEYVMLAALLGVASMTAVGILGNEVSDTFRTASDEMAAAGGINNVGALPN